MGHRHKTLGLLIIVIIMESHCRRGDTVQKARLLRVSEQVVRILNLKFLVELLHNDLYALVIKPQVVFIDPIIISPGRLIHYRLPVALRKGIALMIVNHAPVDCNLSRLDDSDVVLENCVHIDLKHLFD